MSNTKQTIIAILLALLVTIVILSLASCGDSFPSPPKYKDAPTMFIVKNINQLDGMKNQTSYDIEVVDVNGLVKDNKGNNLIFTMTDSVGKYRLGQPIHFGR